MESQHTCPHPLRNDQPVIEMHRRFPITFGDGNVHVSVFTLFHWARGMLFGVDMRGIGSINQKDEATEEVVVGTGWVSGVTGHRGFMTLVSSRVAVKQK